jgi:hypothetical protein
MNEFEITAEQAAVVASWAEQGHAFLSLVLHVRPPSYARDWADRDLLVTQGDAYIHIDSLGRVKDAVPPSEFRLG